MNSEPSASRSLRRVDAMGQSMRVNIHSSSTRVDTDSVFTDDDAFVGDIDVPSPFTDSESVIDVTVAINSNAHTPQSPPKPKGPSFEIWVYRGLAAVAALYFAADFIAYETLRLLDKWGPFFDQLLK